MESQPLDGDRLSSILSRIIEEAKGAFIDFKGIKGVFGTFRAIPKVVEKVQKIGDELNLLGSDRKELAIMAVLLLVPDRWIPDALLRPFVSWAIESAYNALKAKAQ